MKTHLQSAARVFALLALLVGAVYPLTVTTLARLVFPHQSGGSLTVSEGKMVGSELIAQPLASPRYFHPRPSAADYATVPSGASNLSPSSEALREVVAARTGALGRPAEEIPSDLLHASGSGLDPHLSPAAAEFQAARVAQARGLPAETVRALIQKHTEPPQWGLFGQPRLNVLRLNLALDQIPH